MLKPLTFTIVLCTISLHLIGQNTLPEFSVVTFGNNKNIISWVNPYPNVSQVNIQRSRDSLKSFTSILSIPDPSNRQNGFVDAKPPTPFVFYRLFIVFDNGTYLFTNSKRAFWDTVKTIAPKPREPQALLEPVVKNTTETVKADPVTIKKEQPKTKPLALEPPVEVKVEETKPPALPQTKTEKGKLPNEAPVRPVIEKPAIIVEEPLKPVERTFVVKRRDSILFVLEEKNFKKFVDSLNFKTKDSIAFRTIDTIEIRPLLIKEVYKPSRFLVSDKSGNILLMLPEAGPKLYSLKFYDENKILLFEIKKIKEDGLVLDKANFLEAGWYDFELFEDGKLKEKNKVLIPKD